MDVKALALKIRIGAMEEFKALGFGHLGGSLSICDLLAVLYGGEMRYRAEEPGWPERDKLVCSKGHAGPAIYAALGLMGFFPYDGIKTLNKPGTIFPSHCDRNKTPGIDMTTGSLGQGTSLAVGVALGDRLRGRDSRTFLVVGDGELNEGQVWEAAMFSAARGLSNLYWFIDYNKKQLDGTIKDILNPFDIPGKFTSFGFHTQIVNGNDTDVIQAAIDNCKNENSKPHAIILDTVKGAGVPEVMEMEMNHGFMVTQEECDRWIGYLQGELAKLEGRDIR